MVIFPFSRGYRSASSTALSNSNWEFPILLRFSNITFLLQSINALRRQL